MSLFIVKVLAGEYPITFDNIFLYSRLQTELKETKVQLQKAQLLLEIDEETKRRQLAEITETEYFIQLQQKIRRLKSDKT